MTTKRFISLVERECIKPILEKNKIKAEELEVIQVWYCKTIQNHKGLFIIKDKTVGQIYPYFIEATYNGDLEQLYLDFYRKSFKNIIEC